MKQRIFLIYSIFFALFMAGEMEAAMAQSYKDGFVLIKGGTFLMGSPDSEHQRDSDERQHSVTISDFYCSRYEVTQEEYESVMGSNPSYHKGATLPVECVSWFDAVTYCNKKSEICALKPCYKISDGGKSITYDKASDGYRLLTEAEWEYAHRAGTTGTFITKGYTTSREANFYGCYPYLIEENYLRHTNKDVVTGPVRGETIAVGSFPCNNFGLFDTAGNVAEWCFDLYGEYGSPVTSGYLHVARGGGYNDFGKHLRSAYRSAYDGETKNSKRGFRVCRSIKDSLVNDALTIKTSDSIKTGGFDARRVLIVYFSYSGNTRNTARMIEKMTGCTLIELIMEDAYRGNIYDVSQRDLNALKYPALKNKKIDMTKYDAILLGYPTWWATIPRPIATFVRDNDLKGKLIAPFQSHGGTVYGDAPSDLAKIAKGARVANCFEYEYSGGRDLEGRLKEWLSGILK